MVAAASTQNNTHAEGSRILLVEDDPAFTYLCKRYLRADTSNTYHVVSAASVAEASAVAVVDNFDCMVVDYQLPDGLGTEFVNALTKPDGVETAPAILLTANESKQVAVEAIRSGACDFMEKAAMTKSSLLRAVSNAVEIGKLEKANLERMRELEVANALLIQRNEEIQRFYHTVSHEVKTPLTAIQEFVSIVCDGLAGDIENQQKTILQYALESCGQITQQFNDLLELSRFETGKMTVDLSPGSIYEVFDHCFVAAAPAAEAKGITLSIADSPGFPMVMMQRDRIIQTLSNLINNAIKFTDAGGKVLISSKLSEDRQRLSLCVSDTGCGIPPADLKRIFDRLYQVTPSSDRADTSGLGLGLSIASEIVSLHGSELVVESVVGQGSRFSLELCVAKSTLDSQALDAAA